ncbi:retroviral-like aspartic protease family protein [Planctomycetota bacterium]|nr:retroviral-like aspartic protease family protein [Planctomycetota bacterium]
MDYLARRAAYLSLMLAGGVLIGTSEAQASRYVLGDASSIAPDQPRVLFGLYDVPEGEEPDDSHLVGPVLYNVGLLDTGANGILLAASAFANLDGSTTNANDYSPFEQAVNPTTGEPVMYDELGVAGTEALGVLKSYTFGYNGYNDTNVHVIEDVHAFGRNNLNIGSYSAIIGMPAMMDKYTYVNMTSLRSNAFGGDIGDLGDYDYISSTITNTRQDVVGPEYDVNLRLVDVPPTGQRHPDDPTPTYAPLPVIDDIVTTFDDGEASGTFLLDTGAQTNIISMQMALDMGLNMDPDDENTDIQDFLTVGGIGGQAEMPLVQIDELIVPLANGDEMVWTNVVVGVLDIDGAPFDAVFGMNMLTSGYSFLDLVSGTNTPEHGFFDGFTLDFAQGDTEGLLSLDWNDNRVIPEPGTAALIGVGLFLAYAKRSRKKA